MLLKECIMRNPWVHLPFNVGRSPYICHHELGASAISSWWLKCLSFQILLNILINQGNMHDQLISILFFQVNLINNSCHHLEILNLWIIYIVILAVETKTVIVLYHLMDEWMNFYFDARHLKHNYKYIYG